MRQWSRAAGEFVCAVLILLACGAAVGAKQGMVTTPTPPTLLSPGNHAAGTIVTSLSPTFSWNTVFDAETYGIVVRKSPYTERDTVFKADGRDRDLPDSSRGHPDRRRGISLVHEGA